MNRTPSLPAITPDLPDRRLLADYAYVAYFVALLLAPAALPPLLVSTAGMGYVPALVAVLQGVAVGYLAGVALLLRPARD